MEPIHGKDQSTSEPTPVTSSSGSGNGGERLHVVDEGNGATPTASLAITEDKDAVVAAATGLRLVGLSWGEAAGSPGAAKVLIKHGATAAAGTLVVPIDMSSDESGIAWFGPRGIAVPNGVSIEFVSGTSDVVLYTSTE